MPVHTKPRQARVGIDVGGTFTDFVLFDPQREAFVYHKEASTPSDPALAIQKGLSTLLDKSGLSADSLALILHGTTIGLNAILQRKGARIGLVVTTGFRDILEIGRARMPSSFDFHSKPEAPLLSRDYVLEINARLDHGGRVMQEPDNAELDRVAAGLRKLDVEAAALMLINGYAGPEAEGRVADALQARVPDIAIVSAARTWPEIREYERTLVSGLNAYIQPLMYRYFQRLQSLLAELDVRAPLLITASNGGSLSLASALQRPIDTVLSGPAAGVVAAARLSADVKLPRILSFDMGGTSSDIAVSLGGQAEIATRTHIGGLPLVVPVVDVSAIGAGGGSIIWVDAHGVLKAGPESAGADPGPVAYARGGMRPTITDCYLATGIIDPATFLGGAMPLRRDLAEQVLSEVGAHLGFAAEGAAARAASGALAVATAQMATELQKALAQRGQDPADFTLVPFGGAGPTHANLLAVEAGLNHIVIPARPGTFCALGAATADLRRDFVRSLRTPLTDESCARLRETLQTLEADAEQWLAEQGQDLCISRQLIHAADMRYSGQAYELQVQLPVEPSRPLSMAAVAQAFHAEHERIYGFCDESAPIELGTVRLAIVGYMPSAATPTIARDARPPAPCAKRRIFLDESWIEADIYARGQLLAGQAFDGPAIVEQDDTTILVLAGWRAETDDLGNLHLALASSGQTSDGQAPGPEQTR